MGGIQYADGSDREFAFTKKNFETICRLIYEHAGISLKASKQHMVYSRLTSRLRATKTKSFNEYLDLLTRDGNELELELFVNSLTTNLTSFFREAHHFPILTELIEKQKNDHPVALWCSAASTGEEAYSMAITVAEAYGSFTPNVSIIATDVDTEVLTVADKGIYPAERVEKLSGDMIKRYFLRGTGDRSGYVRVRPELRAMVTFRQVNLLSNNWGIRGPLDAIFCRNVMIYFDKETQLNILERFVPLLDTKGLIFAGHSESFFNAMHIIKSCGHTVYELSKPETHIMQIRR